MDVDAEHEAQREGPPEGIPVDAEECEHREYGAELGKAQQQELELAGNEEHDARDADPGPLEAGGLRLRRVAGDGPRPGTASRSTRATIPRACGASCGRSANASFQRASASLA